MRTSLEDDLLRDFAGRFFGYGNFHGPIWFVGMEERGAASIQEVNKRLSAWVRRGRRELEDVAEFHKAIGKTDLFQDRPRLQRTWSKLIRVLFAKDGVEPSRRQIRDFQANDLGRKNSDHCLLELLPLPSPSTRDWMYEGYSRLEFLPQRVKRLRQRIKTLRPKVVVFYGRTYLEHWKAICEGVQLQEKKESIFTGESDSTLFVVTKHPVAHGVSNGYFDEVGRLIAKHRQLRKR